MILLHHKTLVSVETSENSLDETLWLKKKKEKRCDDTSLTNTGLHFKTSNKKFKNTYLFVSFFFMYNV